MAVHDVAALAGQAKFAQNMLGGARVGNVPVVGVLDLHLGRRVSNIEPLKRRHGTAAKQRRFCPAPQVPQKVLSGQPCRAARGRAVALAGAAVTVVEQLLAAAGGALKPNGRKRAVLGHRHCAVVEQIAVAHFIKRAVGVQKLHMALQALTLGKAAHQLGGDLFLISSQRGRVGRVNGGKVAVQQGIGRAEIVHRARGKVNVVQKVAALQIEIRVAGNDLCLQLEHHNGHGLVHPRGGGQVACRCALVGVGQPARNIGIRVSMLGKALQAAQADAVAALQRVQIVVGQRCFQHGHNAERAARCRAHPDHVVVAPLDVHLMMRHETVQNAVRARAAVKQVAHNVQTVHSQPLDDLAEADNIGVGAVIADDALNDLAVILVLVVVLKVGVKQLVEDVAAVLRQTAAHMVAGMLAGHEPAQVDEPQQRHAIPGVQVFLAGFQLGQLLIGIIDERRQLGTLLGGDTVAKHRVDFFTDDARCAV